jgi:predicted nucleotidyltransferase
MPRKNVKIPQKDGKKNKHPPVKKTKTSAERRPIDLLFGSGARVDVLWCLMRNPAVGLEQSEIIHATKRSLKDVQRSLSILQELGLVVKIRGLSGQQGATSLGDIHLIDTPEWMEGQMEVHGRTRYYVVENDPWIAPLRMLLECAIGGLDLVKHKVREIQGVYVSFIFGSMATSDQKPYSDIDLMVIGDHDQLKLDDEIAILEKRIRREIQVISYTPGEWREAYQKKAHFVVSLMEAPKIFLKSDNQELMDIAVGSKE